jgi:hypothetical protein
MAWVGSPRGKPGEFLARGAYHNTELADAIEKSVVGPPRWTTRSASAIR